MIIIFSFMFFEMRFYLRGHYLLDLQLRISKYICDQQYLNIKVYFYFNIDKNLVIFFLKNQN